MLCFWHIHNLFIDKVSIILSFTITSYRNYFIIYNVHVVFFNLMCLPFSSGVLPKAYLVMLIVGATIAAFLACIPYDFYKFRKRKKKVRDHQERLSLVTRIAPGHAKVMLDTTPESVKSPPQAPRRFGLKSLFSVFRFVGSKAKTSTETTDSPPTSHDESGNGKGKTSANGDGGTGSNCSKFGRHHSRNSGSSSCGGGGSSAGGGCSNNKELEEVTDDPTSSTLIFSSHHSTSCPAADNDVMDIYPVSNSTADHSDEEVLVHNDRNAKGTTVKSNTNKPKMCVGSLVTQIKGRMTTNKDGEILMKNTVSPLEENQNVPELSPPSSSNSSPERCVSVDNQSTTGLIGYEGREDLHGQSDTYSFERHSLNNVNVSNTNASSVSEPALVEVTPINNSPSSSSSSSSSTSSPPSLATPNTERQNANGIIGISNGVSISDLSQPKLVSTPSSASTPDVTFAVKKKSKGDKYDAFRTFHCPTDGLTNASYHSMPAISDSP